MVFYFCLRYTRIYSGTEAISRAPPATLQSSHSWPWVACCLICTALWSYNNNLQISRNYLADAMGNPMIWWYGDIYIYNIHTIYIYIRIYIYISLSLSPSPCGPHDDEHLWTCPMFSRNHRIGCKNLHKSTKPDTIACKRMQKVKKRQTRTTKPQLKLKTWKGRSLWAAENIRWVSPCHCTMNSKQDNSPVYSTASVVAPRTSLVMSGIDAIPGRQCHVDMGGTGLPLRLSAVGLQLSWVFSTAITSGSLNSCIANPGISCQWYMESHQQLKTKLHHK